MILTNSYHGSHSDLVTATGGKAGGILPDCWEYVQWIESPRQLLEYLTRWGKEEVAAVLLEPLTPSCQDWQLQEVQEECKKRGALLVLDEIITGWRVREGSAVPSIKADLYCFGKAIGGGWPLACLGGQEEYMNHLLERVFMSGTHAGEQASLQAASFLLQQIHDTPDFYPFIQQWGCQLGLELEGIVRGYPQRWQLTLPQEEHYRFIDTLAREGILVGRDVFPLYSHSRLPDREAVLTIFEKAREEACP
jgi:glutamate-1-semialdehyde aminotransferase